MATAAVAAAGSGNGKASKLEYLCGFGNHHATEAIPGALPQGQNTPQVCPLGTSLVLWRMYKIGLKR